MRKSAVLASIVLILGILSASTAQGAPGCTATTTNITGYVVVTFNGVGPCTWNTPGGVSTVDVLIVGGGGGGGAALGYAAGNGGTGVVIIRYAGSAGDFTTGKNASGIYRSNISLVVTVYSPGKVTFYAKSKIIPGCNRIITVGSGPYTASCSYKLSTHGSIPITAKLVPDSAPGSPILLNGGSASIAVRSSKR